jgi:DNA-binding XRE family transcriptional regulator
MNKKTKNKKMGKATDFQVLLKEMLKDKEFKKHYDEYGRQLEISYRVLQLRKKAKMSQSELARKIGTTQSNIARMEGGRQNFTLNTLNKIASIFDKQLKVSIC